MAPTTSTTPAGRQSRRRQNALRVWAAAALSVLVPAALIAGPAASAETVPARHAVSTTATLHAAYQARAGLTVDGILAPATIKAFQRALLVPADGILGPATVKALQRSFGLRADGVLGPATIKYLQRYLFVPADGILGPATVKALQRRLNRGTF